MSASGAATFNDQVTIGGNLVHAGNMTVDVAGDLTLDADGGDVIISDGGSEKARFSSGKLAIGTSSPVKFLDVGVPTTASAIDANIRLNTHYGTQNTARGGIQMFDGTNVTAQIDTRYDGSKVDMHFGSLFSGGYNTTSRMVITGSGEVGIGTSSPSSYYADNLVVSSDDDSGITLASSATTHKAFLAFADGTSGAEAYQGYLAYDHNNNSLQLGTSGSERARLDDAGRLLAGRTSTITFSSNSADGVVIQPSRIDVSASSLSRISQIRNSTGTYDRFYNGANIVGSITCTTSATAYNTSSDARLKDVTGTARGLEVINELNPVAYNWKADGKADEGLIAQEVKELVPNAVVGSEEDMYSMDYSKLVVHLVAGMKEQQKQIEDLQTQINNLRGK
jgi:hypothetical protein